MHVPAIGIAANDHVGLLVEYVNWARDTNEGDVDESLNVTVDGHF